MSEFNRGSGPWDPALPQDIPAQRSTSRRRFLALGAGAFALTALPVAAWVRRQRLVRRQLPLMGTVADIIVVHEDERLAQRAIDVAFARMGRVERTMSRFLDSSDIGRANLEAARAAVPVAGETAGLLRTALAWARATDGVFDPCIGRMVGLWDVKQRNQPPRTAAIRPLAGRRLYRALHLDGDSVFFADGDIALDLGGIAKGYGVDLAISALREQGMGRAMVNVGGDLAAIGVSEDGDPWRVGVRSPFDPNRILRSIEVHDEAVATSGDYEQFFHHGGRKYHHLMEPATGEPRRSELHTVTVVAASCTAADAAATAVFGRETADAEALIRRQAPEARIA